MHLIIADADFHDQPVECPHCHWKGTVKELKRDERLPLTNITEIFCPQCEKYLGFIQHDGMDTHWH